MIRVRERVRPSNGLRIGIVLGLVVLAAVQLPGSTTGAQGDAPSIVELNGVGASEVSPLMTAWASAMYESPSGLSVSYLPKGDKDSRLAFARGEDDFAISGRPFTAEELELLDQRDVDLIEAPIAVTTMAFLLSGPARKPIQTIAVAPGFDPDDPDAPLTSTPIAGPLRVPNSVVARAILESGASTWRNPEFAATFAPLVLNPPSANPKTVVRSDPSAMNYYLETFIRSVVKDDYTAALTAAQIDPDTVSESWPLRSTPSRTGDDAIAVLVGSGSEAGGNLQPAGGVIAAVSPSAANRQIALQPGKLPPDQPVPLYTVNVQNGAGEWVAPTPETITAAAAAGNGAALPGLTDPVPGAYPLTWISSIAVPASGLAPDRATALATFLRFAVTEGQNAAAPLGEGRLPATLVATALTAADRIVTSNCTGSDRKLVTVDGGGPFWPTAVAAPATTKVCRAIVIPGATTTTTFVGPANAPAVVAGTATGPSGSSRSSGSSGGYASGSYSPDDLSSDSSTFGDLGGDVAVEAATDDAPSDGAPQNDQLAVSTVAAQLPMELPPDGRFGLDRLATAALGGVAFLVLRALTRKRLGATS